MATMQLTRMSVSRQVQLALDDLKSGGAVYDWRLVQELDGPRSFYVIETLGGSPAIRTKTRMMTTGETMEWLAARGWVVAFGQTEPRPLATGAES